MGVIEKSALLKDLRIERDVPDPRSRTPLWVAMSFTVLLASVGVAWFTLVRHSVLLVHTAAAQPMAMELQKIVAATFTR